MIEIRNLAVTFETDRGDLQAVRGVTLTLSKGEIVGIVGESGSGKSVTAHSLLRLIPRHTIREGEVLIDGDEILSMPIKELRPLRGGKCSMIFQEPGRSFDPLYTVGKTLRETIKTHNRELGEDAIHKKSIKLLNEVGIYNPEERLVNYPHQLSGGQLQRVMIALAISSDPEYLIADEPTTALDVTIQAKIIGLIKKLKEERGLGVLFITHNLSLLRHFADRVVVMYSGLILEEGSAEDVYNNPLHPYTRALLASIPQAGNHYSQAKLVPIEGAIPDPVNLPSGCPFAPRCRFCSGECTSGLPELKLLGNGHRYRCILQPEASHA